ncbi:MAG TPA: nuclear transport factor 2 family protein [Gaiellaceae bacterium]
MAFRFALGLAIVLATSGCSSTPPSAGSVVRAWSEALNTGDNEAAAKLFAPGAEIVQARLVLHLATHQQAVAWNTALPCSGTIVSIVEHGDTARATFVLGDRQKTKCDGPGETATTIVRVRQGKIVLWQEKPIPPPPVTTTGPVL